MGFDDLPAELKRLILVHVPVRDGFKLCKFAHAFYSDVVSKLVEEHITALKQRPDLLRLRTICGPRLSRGGKPLKARLYVQAGCGTVQQDRRRIRTYTVNLCQCIVKYEKTMITPGTCKYSWEN